MTVESVLAHGLKTSVFGSQWNVEHGDNLALLDPDRIKSDLLANRPAFGVAHRFFFATDNQKLYYDTGTAWIEQTAASAAHAASHASGGGDAVTLAQSQVTNLTADLAGKEAANANIQAHVASTANPHAVTKAQLGLANADNTSDMAKPVSTATQTALNGKVATTGNESIAGVKSFTDSIAMASGKGMDYTATLKSNSGTGCTLNVTAAGNIISGNPGVTAAGQDYKVGDCLSVAGGTGGCVRVATLSGTGVATVVTFNAGSAGYTTTSGVATSYLSTAASRVNTDYEEGAWIPRDASGGNLTAFTNRTATYVRIGSKVFANFDLTYPSTANGSNASIGGLPFLSNASAAYGIVNFGSHTYGTALMGYAGNSVTAFNVVLATTGVPLTNANLSTLRLIGQVIYDV